MICSVSTAQKWQRGTKPVFVWRTRSATRVRITCIYKAIIGNITCI